MKNIADQKETTSEEVVEKIREKYGFEACRKEERTFFNTGHTLPYINFVRAKIPAKLKKGEPVFLRTLFGNHKVPCETMIMIRKMENLENAEDKQWYTIKSGEELCIKVIPKEYGTALIKFNIVINGQKIGEYCIPKIFVGDLFCYDTLPQGWESVYNGMENFIFAVKSNEYQIDVSYHNGDYEIRIFRIVNTSLQELEKVDSSPIESGEKILMEKLWSWMEFLSKSKMTERQEKKEKGFDVMEIFEIKPKDIYVFLDDARDISRKSFFPEKKMEKILEEIMTKIKIKKR